MSRRIPGEHKIDSEEEDYEHKVCELILFNILYVNYKDKDLNNIVEYFRSECSDEHEVYWKIFSLFERAFKKGASHADPIFTNMYREVLSEDKFKFMSECSENLCEEFMKYIIARLQEEYLSKVH